jgi:hypothetical protein
MEIVLKLTPEEYNLVHKGLSKLSIEEALPTLNKIVAEVQNQINRPATEEVKE